MTVDKALDFEAGELLDQKVAQETNLSRAKFLLPELPEKATYSNPRYVGTIEATFRQIALSVHDLFNPSGGHLEYSNQTVGVPVTSKRRFEHRVDYKEITEST